MLPKSNIDLTNGIVFQDQPSLTWIADPVTNRLRGRGGGWEAIRQAVEESRQMLLYVNEMQPEQDEDDE